MTVRAVLNPHNAIRTVYICEMTSRFEINWILDEEDEPLDAASLLGRLVISDGVESIDEPSVYIDSWFASLIRASESATQDAAEIEIPEHPQRLVVWCDEKEHLHLAFRNSEVIAESLEEFKRVLKQRARFEVLLVPAGIDSVGHVMRRVKIPKMI